MTYNFKGRRKIKRLGWILAVCLILGLSLALTGSVLIGCKKQVEEVAELKPEAPEPTSDKPASPPLPDEDEIEFKLIEKITLPPDTQDVILDKDTGRPKAIILKDALKFFNKENIIKEIKTEGKRASIVRSKTGKFFGIYESLEIDEAKDLVIRSQFSFYDSAGNLIWQKDGLGECRISDDGETAVNFQDALIGDSTITFYNKTDTIKKVKPFDNKYFAGGLASFSDDGSNYAVVIIEPATLILYNNNGDELWRKTLGNNLHPYGISISKHGHFIIALATNSSDGAGHVFCFDKTGVLLWVKKRFGGKAAVVFSPNSDFVTLLTQDSKKISLVNSSSGNIRWSQKYENDNSPIPYKICSVNVSKNALFVLIGVEPIQTNKPLSSYTYLLDQQGNIVWMKKYNSCPIGVISEDEKYIYIVGDGKVERLQER